MERFSVSLTRAFVTIVAIFLVVAAFMLLGCAAQPQLVYRTQTVSVPVPVQASCNPPAQTHPKLPISSIGASTSDADVVRDYAESVSMLEGEVIAREKLLDGCRTPAEAGVTGAP